jgi:serine-type D-Ala-D-Ala carboxypeptidase/endopeptidase
MTRTTPLADCSSSRLHGVLNNLPCCRDRRNVGCFPPDEPGDPDALGRAVTSTRTDLAGRLEVPLRAMAAASHGPATVLAALWGGERAVACHGTPAWHTDTAVDAHTLFELGSVTKTFTALLLAEMAVRGEVGYDDPITAYLPPGALPRRAAAKSITLAHLATYTGGLSRVPTNVLPSAVCAWWTNPYAGYRLDDLYRATTRIRPRNPPGTRVRYSNFGVGLLGQLLANAAGRDYPGLVIDRVCRPLGLAGTRAVAGPGCASGYRRDRPVPPWEMGALAAAGSLRSSATDLLRYLDAQLHPQATPLTNALRAVQLPRAAVRGKDSICLVWNHRAFPRYELFFHGGATRGFTAFLGFCRQADVGVIALTNGSWTRQNTVIPTGYALLKTLSAP